MDPQQSTIQNKLHDCLPGNEIRLTHEYMSVMLAVLPRFVELAMNMTGGSSAGLSLYRPESLEFQWKHMCGILARFEGAMTPRNYSPCGVTLDNDAPVLCRHPEWGLQLGFRRADRACRSAARAVEGGRQGSGGNSLDCHRRRRPLYIGTSPGRYGTRHSRWDRVACVKRSEEQLRLALEVQETLTREMNHRVKNLFSLADGMIRKSMKHSATKEEMAQALSSRLRALASAYSLVLREDVVVDAHLDLEELIRTMVSPHDHRVELANPRVEIRGHTVACGKGRQLDCPGDQ